MKKLFLLVSIGFGALSVNGYGAPLIQSSTGEEVFKGGFGLDTYGKIAGPLTVALGPVAFKFSDRYLLKAYFGDVSSVLTLKRVSPDGARVSAVYRVHSSQMVHPDRWASQPKLKPILGSNREYFDVLLELEPQDCDDQSMSRAASPGDSIESVIKDFYESRVDGFEFCRFQVVSALLMDAPRSEYVEDVSLPKTQLTFLKSGEVLMQSNMIEGEHRDFLSHVTGAQDDVKAAAVWTEAEKFVQILRNYGELLILSRDQSKTERENIVFGYLQKHKADLVQSLKAVNDGYASLSFQAKIKLAQMVTRNYRQVHFLEGKLVQKFNLDEVMSK